ncbi:DUF6602 domain-containing protein [Haloarcula marismortui]|uniref:DUF6602 domain-containing protein n=1 Tax=Haloarcula marismortui TaxID=2238 RepID=UPI0012FEA997|nr:DUF6602 domain-containing protein [Haloarcula taiwanensis]
MTDDVTELTEENIEQLFPEIQQYRETVGDEGIERMLDLLGDFSEELQHNWERISKRKHNPSRKGDAFENTLKGFLESYFTSAFDIRIGCSVVDSELRCFNEFDYRQNEFDVVSSFRTAVPNIVFSEDNMYWVPYDGVAFICEVKSKLTKDKLEGDLSKLDILRKIRGNPSDRFPDNISGTNMMVPHQLHCLIYDKNEINQQTQKELLYEYPNSWDLLLIVNEDKLLMNSTLPYAHKLFNNEGQEGEFQWCHIDNGLLWLIVTLSVSIPQPPVVYTINPLVKMASFMGASTGGGHYKH